MMHEADFHSWSTRSRLKAKMPNMAALLTLMATLLIQARGAEPAPNPPEDPVAPAAALPPSQPAPTIASVPSISANVDLHPPRLHLKALGPRSALIAAVPPADNDVEASEARPKRRARGEDDSIELRLDRLEQLVESLVRQGSERKSKASAAKDLAAKAKNLAEEDRVRMKENATREAERATREVERAINEVKRNGDFEPFAQRNDEKALGAARSGLNAHRKALRKQQEQLEKQLQALDQQVQKLESDQSRREEERSSREGERAQEEERERKKAEKQGNEAGR